MPQSSKDKSDDNPLPAIPAEATARDLYTPALSTDDISIKNAPFYFERFVERQMNMSACSRERAEKIERDNLAYWADYFSDAARNHVKRVFDARHPVFGPSRPSPEAAQALSTYSKN